MKRSVLILLVPMAAACVPRGATPAPVSAPASIPAPPQQAPPPPGPRAAPGVPRGAAPDPGSARAAMPAPQQQAPRPPEPGPTPPVVTPSTALAAWADAPLSPGRWLYQPARGTGSRALFGPLNAPSFQVACTAGRLLTLTRSGAAAGTLTIRTTSTLRTLPGTRRAGG